MSEPAICTARLVGHGRPGSLSAWCPVTNLVAIVTSAPSANGVSIQLIEPNNPREHYELKLPSSACSTISNVASISWSPAGCRRALLVTMTAGHSIVWMQEPNDETHTEAAPLPAINCWYATPLEDADTVAAAAPAQPGSAPAGSAPALPHAGGALEEEPDYFATDAEPPSQPLVAGPSLQADLRVAPAAADARGNAQENRVVYATWLSAPPSLTWDSAKATASTSTQHPMDAPFLPDLEGCLPPASWTAVQHWLRPSQLAAVVVRESGQATVWWSTMSTRSLARISWRNQQVALPLQGPVKCASACCSLPNAVRVAAVSAHDAAVVQIFEVSGTMTLHQLPNTPPAHKVSTTHVASIQLSQLLSMMPSQLLSSSLSLLPSSYGSALLVATSSEAGEGPDALQEDARLHLLRQATVHSPWALAATYDATGASVASAGPGHLKLDGGDARGFKEELAQAAGAGPEEGPSMAVSSDGSSVAVFAGGRLHALDSATLQLRQTCDGLLAPGASGRGAALCWSPNSCCMAVAVSLAPSQEPQATQTQPQRLAAGSHGSGASQLSGAWAGGLLFRVLLVPEAAVTNAGQPAEPPTLLDPCAPPPAAPLGVGHEARAALAARLDAYRLAFAALTGQHPWDAAARCTSAGCSAAEALHALDQMFMSSDEYCRPSYLTAVDRMKLAVLQRVPGRMAQAVAADLTARCLLKHWQPVMTALNTTHSTPAGTNTDAATAAAEKQARLEDLARLQPWLTWGHDYFMLMMASIKRLQLLSQQQAEGGGAGNDGLAAAADLADALPGLRLMQDAATMQKLGQLLIGWNNASKALARHGDIRAIAEHESLIRAFVTRFSPQRSEQEQQQQHASSPGRSGFSGPYQLHVAKPTRPSTVDEILHMLRPSAAPAGAELTGEEQEKRAREVNHALLVPDLTAEQLMRRARELGICASMDNLSRHPTMVTAAQRTTKAWQAWRRGKPPLQLLHNTSAQSLPKQQQASRWRQQRTHALLPLGSAVTSGSQAVAAAALEMQPLLDLFSGKPLPWETANITYECTDGLFATCELLAPDNSQEIVGAAGRPGARRTTAGHAAGGQAMLRRMWLGSQAPAGGMWKRLKVKHVVGQGT